LFGSAEGHHVSLGVVAADGRGEQAEGGARQARQGPRQLLGILNANRKIGKRTDTDVAFTREYSRLSIFHRERECTN